MKKRISVIKQFLQDNIPEWSFILQNVEKAP